MEIPGSYFTWMICDGNRLSRLKNIGSQLHFVDIVPTLVEVSGRTYPETYRGEELSPMEGISLMPLIIKAPGREPAVSHSLVELLDLYPTIAELAGLEYSQHLQGESLTPVLEDPDHAVREVAFSMHRWGGAFSYLLRSDKWAYIQYDEDGGSGMELYDMEHDPKQYNNLAHNPQYQEVVDEFQQRLQQKLKEVRDNNLDISYKANKSQ